MRDLVLALKHGCMAKRYFAIQYNPANYNQASFILFILLGNAIQNYRLEAG